MQRALRPDHLAPARRRRHGRPRLAREPRPGRRPSGDRGPRGGAARALRPGILGSSCARRHPSHVRRVLPGPGPPGLALVVADPQRPDAAADRGRHGAVQALLPGRRRAGAPARGHRCRRSRAPSTSRTSAAPPATSRSSRCSATSASATTSSARRSAGPGSCRPRPSAEGGFGFDPERIWATVYEDDDEAEQLWLRGDRRAGRRAHRAPGHGRTTSGRPAGRARAGRAASCTTTAARSTAPTVARRSTRRATWSSGTSCSCSTSATRDGNILGELPQQNVDTGMGLERMAMLLQDVPNVYETDVLRPMLDRADRASPGLPTATTRHPTSACA